MELNQKDNHQLKFMYVHPLFIMQIILYIYIFHYNRLPNPSHFAIHIYKLRAYVHSFALFIIGFINFSIASDEMPSIFSVLCCAFS